jgi:1,4-dihydroxy-2-naphthoate octaprenyltransferase
MSAVQNNSGRSTARSYARLAKVDVPELWVGVPIAWSLVPSDQRLEPRVLVSLALSWFAVVAVTSAAQALDDYQGWHDGTDDENYDPASGRSRARKPLLEGALSPDQALRFGIVAAALGALALVAMAALASFQPVWVWIGMTVAVGLALQYSFGAKLSYRVFGGGEVTLALAMTSTVALPYAAVTEDLPALVAVEALLVGFWILQVSICSSTNDAVGDRRAGRKTVAATVSDRSNHRFILGVFVVQWAIGAIAIVTGVLSWWQAVALVPTWVAQVVQLRRGLGAGDWIAARKAGFLGMRIGAVLLFAANLLSA